MTTLTVLNNSFEIQFFESGLDSNLIPESYELKAIPSWEFLLNVMLFDTNAELLIFGCSSFAYLEPRMDLELTLTPPLTHGKPA